MDIVTLGEPLFEFAHIRGTEWRAGHGGDVSNVAIAAARQGACTAIVTRLGDDGFADSFRKLWDTDGIDHSHVATDPDAPTGLYFIRQTPDGHVFDYRRKGSAASRLCPASLPEEPLRQTKILHFSGITQAISDSADAAARAAAQIAREAGAQISYDPNLRLKLWPLDKARPAIEEALSLADIALPSLDDARQITGLETAEDILAHIHSLGPKIIALTMGAQGTLVSDGTAQTHIPATQVDAVDATGAGDCFDGAFLARLAAGDAPVPAARYASAAAAIAVTGHGAVAPIPHAGLVRDLLATAP
ncbi:sugar kinase [Aestuariibius sp. 2305UL40-4]|uniref:sugar kinase n=1 Tax=Aestuariibius violaceus TaxID=3234132 RepID=UPI00398E4A8E